MWRSFEPLDDDTFQTLQQSLLNYIQTEYLFGPAESDASCECTRILRMTSPLVLTHGTPEPQSCGTSLRTHSLSSSYAHTSTNGRPSSPTSSRSSTHPNPPPPRRSTHTSPSFSSISSSRSLARLLIKWSRPRVNSIPPAMPATVVCETPCEIEMLRGSTKRSLPSLRMGWNAWAA